MTKETPGPQHRLIALLVDMSPELAEEIAIECLRQEFPSHDYAHAAPNKQEVRGGSPMATDATVHFRRDEKAVHFSHIEVQNEFTGQKFADLRAYHGSEVRKLNCGGLVMVLSPDPGVTASFRKAERERGAELAYAGHISPERI
jgi:hypothetical protein